MSNDFERFLIQKATTTRTPIKVSMELTPLCNMDCKMCYVRQTLDEAQRNGGIKPVSYWKNYIPEMQKMGVLFVTLIGGEPFLYPELETLYSSLCQSGFYVNITTNATLLAKGIPEWLMKQPPRYVTVSLYGGSNETYEKVTGNKIGYSQTIQGLENLLKAKIPVKLNYVIVPENENDLKHIFELSEYYQLPLLAASYCFPGVCGKSNSFCNRLTAQECAKKELEILKLKKDDKSLSRIAYLAKEKFQKNTVRHTDHMYCQSGKSTFWINWKGQMMACRMIDSISIEVSHGKLLESWKLLQNCVENAVISPECASCEKREVCSVCPAMMEAETGSIKGHPEYLCQMTDELIRLCREKEKDS